MWYNNETQLFLKGSQWRKMLLTKWCSYSIYSTSKLDSANLWNLDPLPSDFLTAPGIPKSLKLLLRVNVIPHIFCEVKSSYIISQIFAWIKTPTVVFVSFFFFLYITALIPSLCHSPWTVTQINGASGCGDGQFLWASVLKAGFFIRESKHSVVVDIWEPQIFYSVIFLWRTFTLMQNNTRGDFLIICLKKSFMKFLHLLNPKLRIDCHFNKHIHTFFLCFSSIN